MTHFLNNIRINKNTSPTDQVKDFINKIEKHTNTLEISNFIDLFSKNSNIPRDVLEMEYKQFISRNHNFIIGKFDEIFKFHKF